MGGRSSRESALDDRRAEPLGVVPPLVTVIVTNYNYERFITACLKSVALQTYPHFRCIVVDDCSKDNSVSLIEEFVRSPEAREKFSLIRREQNGGQMAAFKTGLARAEGAFVVLLDADDLLFGDFLAAHLEAHMGPEAVAFTSSDQYQINERDELTGGTHTDLRAKGKYRHIKPRPLHDPFWIWATTSSMMFRKAVLDLIMPDNDEHFRVCADNYICHFANLIGGSLLIPVSYGCYRRHGSNCFSCNPVVGGRLPTGDMDNHPKHHIVRLSILSHILTNHKRFSSVLADDNFFFALLRLTGPYEIMQFKRQYPGYFAEKPARFMRRFLCASLLLKIKLTVSKYLRGLAYLFFHDKRNYSDL